MAPLSLLITFKGDNGKQFQVVHGRLRDDNMLACKSKVPFKKVLNYETVQN